MSPEVNKVITHYFDSKGEDRVNHEALPVVIDDLRAPRWELWEEDREGITAYWQDLLSHFRDGIRRSLGDGSLKDNVSGQRKNGLIRPRVAAAENLSVPLPLDGNRYHYAVRPSILDRTHFPKFVTRVRESFVADNTDLWPQVAAQVEEVLKGEGPLNGIYYRGSYAIDGGQHNDVASMIRSGTLRRNPADIHSGIPENHNWR